MEKAKDYCAYAASCGVIPLAPHTIFTQYLNDAVPEQREQGLRMGHELLERCDELWVMGDTISLLTGKYIHWERHDFCGIVKPESLKEWLLDKPVRNEAAEELTKFVTPELISAAKQNHTACGYPFLIGYAPAEGGLHEAFCLDPDPVNLASFIVKMGKERGDLMICTPLDTPFLNTVGMFTDQCVDFDFLQDHLLPVLIPMQMGKTEPQEIKLTEDQDNEAFLDDFAVEDDMEL